MCVVCIFASQIDEDKSGEISLWELFEALEMKQSKFTKRIFRYETAYSGGIWTRRS